MLQHSNGLRETTTFGIRMAKIRNTDKPNYEQAMNQHKHTLTVKIQDDVVSLGKWFGAPLENQAHA